MKGLGYMLAILISHQPEHVIYFGAAIQNVNVLQIC